MTRPVMTHTHLDLASWGFAHPVETHQNPEALLPHAEVVPLVGQGRRMIRAVGRATALAVISVLKKKRRKGSEGGRSPCLRRASG